MLDFTIYECDMARNGGGIHLVGGAEITSRDGMSTIHREICLQPLL